MDEEVALPASWRSGRKTMINQETASSPGMTALAIFRPLAFLRVILTGTVFAQMSYAEDRIHHGKRAYPG